MSKEIPIIDFSNPAMKRMSLAYVKGLEGLHWFEVRKCQAQRTNPQNAYFHGVCLPLIAARMSELWGEDVGAGRAKEFLKDQFLRRPLVNKSTGEVQGHYVEHTHKLGVGEFVQFLDQVILFAGEQLDLEIPPAVKREECAA